MEGLKVNERIIGQGAPAYIIAEMSGNHNGDLHRALEIVDVAAEAGADAVKIQTYTADTITLNCDNTYFQTPRGSLWEGRTLYDLYKEAYTPWEWHGPIMEKAEKVGLACFSTPFDFTAVDFLEKLEVPAYKIASYEIQDIPLIRKAARTGKAILLSTGIATLADIYAAVEACREEGNEQVALLKCTSAYPSPYEDMNLSVIPHLTSQINVGIPFKFHPNDREAIGYEGNIWMHLRPFGPYAGNGSGCGFGGAGSRDNRKAYDALPCRWWCRCRLLHGAGGVCKYDQTDPECGKGKGMCDV